MHLDPLLRQKLFELKNAQSLKQSNSDLAALLKLFNIHTYSYSHYHYHPRAKKKLKYEHCSANFKPWHEHFLAEKYEEIDSTLHQTYRNILPSVYLLKTQLAEAKTPREREMREDAIRFGAQGGISVPIHGANNDFAHLVLVAMKHDQFLEHAETQIPLFMLIGYYYYDVVFRLIPPDIACTDDILSARERACLHYVAHYFPVEDIAKRLHISVRTVNFHIQNCNKKLGVANKFEAVQKAIELHLISL